jgi:hypothetical protein
MMSNNDKTAALVLVCAAGLFYFVARPYINKMVKNAAKQQRKALGVTRKQIETPIIDEQQLNTPILKNAYLALKAWVTAYNSGESMKDLNTMTMEMRRMLNVTVTLKDGKVVASDEMGRGLLSTK